MTDKLGTVRDVIHNYIYFTVPSKTGEISERELIDSEWVQRLRQIFQLQSAWLIYPNAIHLRFQHSLGVMHLAGEMAYQFYPLFKEAFPEESIPERNYVEEVFRLAGLLHDIGHGPFGHLLDDVYTIPKYGKTHEDISSAIILNELADLIIRIRRSPHGTFHAPISAKQVAKFIKMPGNFKKFSLWEQVFSKIMLGIYSADAMDFLLRDQYFCGTSEFGKINYRNLIDNTIITGGGMTLKKNALPAFRTFLQTRFNMFRHVYLYERNELYDLAFGKLLPEVLKHMRLGNPLKNLSKFKKITDFGLHYIVPTWSNETGELGKIGREWRNMLLRREMPYAKVMDEENFYHNIGETSHIIDRNILEKELRNRFSGYPGLKVLISRNDIRLQQQFMQFENTENFRNTDNIKAISLIDPNSGEFCADEGNEYIKDIPLKYEVIRVYIPEQYSEKIEEKDTVIEQGELFSGQDLIGDETGMREDKTSM
ncbi:MAG: HD domain-containing protein [Elusimicrobiota bacterium]